ncbi:glutaredoxin family protein [Candidatus Bathyarchaeota archaeon]|nr:glutaredoxin family protein [Candidatus Bathyarchaeota archaeon]
MDVNFIHVEGDQDEHDITLLTLSKCGHCTEAKKLMRRLNIRFDYIDVDKSTREEKRKVTQFLKDQNLPLSFPVIIIDEIIISGYREKEILSALEEQ